MSDTILGGDFTVYYSAENRQKRVEWTGSTTGTRTVNELYSALQDLFDELGQMDDGTVMSAQTPTEYTIGIIDSGDTDPWFIDRVTVEHLTGGAIRTASWARSTGSNTGIVRLDYTVGAGTDFAASDIGLTVTHSGGGDSGTLLDFVSDGSAGTAWIRPADETSSNDWDSTGTSIAVTGGTGAGLSQDTAADTGESRWANIFTIGTIEANTHIYVNQNITSDSTEADLLTGYKSTTDWWSDGQIDILVNVQEVGVENDEAVLQVFARQHTKTYDHFELTDLSGGGRNPVPLSTGTDLNNQVGYREMALTDASGDFTVGEIIEDDSDSTIQGVVTSNTGTAPNITLQYYLIGDPLNDFTGASGAFTGQTSSSTATAVAPTDVNASTLTDITITFGADETLDIDEDDTTEDYSIVVDCSAGTGNGASSLSDVYQRLKYLTRRGDTSDLLGTAGDLEGQFYIGSDRRITYESASAAFTTGELITGGTSGAEGRVVGDHNNGTTGYLILRNTRRGGADNNVNFSDGETISGGTSGSTATISTSGVDVITPTKSAPFGTFAGGQFFGAPGVVLINVPTDDASNYQLIDDTGSVVNPPTKVTVQVTNTRQGDKVAVFRLSGGVIEKDYYTANNNPGVGGSSIDVTPTIRVDEPGKSVGGVLRLVDNSADQEYRMRFASWAGSTFTLATQVSGGTDFTLQGGTNDTQLVGAAGDFANNLVGDLVINTTQGNAVSYVIDVDTGTDTLTISPAISGQSSTDTVYINATPIVVEVGVDNIYIPFIDVYETTGADPSGDTEEAVITYNANVPVRVRARHADIPSNFGIIPYSADSTITNTGMTNSIIRTADNIFTP